MSKTKWSKTVAAKQRRVNALRRLEAQYKSGFKIDKNGERVNLSPKDVTRIEKEMETLKSRV